MEDNNKQYNFNSVNLIAFLWKRKISLILVATITFVISAIASLFIENKYLSEVVIFPGAETSVSQDIIVQGGRKDILKLGKEEEIEQMLQILASEDLTNKIIQKYDLINHYGIDTKKEKYPYTVMGGMLKKNIKIKPTKFMSIRISVLDKDPKVAADIANDIANFVDEIYLKMINEKAVKILEIVEFEYFSLVDEINVLEDSLVVLRGYGVLDYNSQVERYAEALGKAIVVGNKAAIKDLEEKLDVLAKYGGPYIAIRDYLTIMRHRLRMLKSKYVEAQVDVKEELPKIFILNKAGAAEKKDSPKRSLIVLSATASSVVLMILFFIISSSLKEEEEL